MGHAQPSSEHSEVPESPHQVVRFHSTVSVRTPHTQETLVAQRLGFVVTTRSWIVRDSSDRCGSPVLAGPA
jgi:hypothetical protein